MKRVTREDLRMALGGTCGVLVANALTDAIYDLLPETKEGEIRVGVRYRNHGGSMAPDPEGQWFHVKDSRITEWRLDPPDTGHPQYKADHR